MHFKIMLKLKACLRIKFCIIITMSLILLSQYAQNLLNYVQVRWASYSAQIYAGIMCQGLNLARIRTCAVCIIFGAILDRRKGGTSINGPILI